MNRTGHRDLPRHVRIVRLFSEGKPNSGGGVLRGNTVKFYANEMQSDVATTNGVRFLFAPVVKRYPGLSVPDDHF